MWQSFVIVLLIINCVFSAENFTNVNNATTKANGPFGRDCFEIRKKLFNDRKQCLDGFLLNYFDNPNTSTMINRNCTKLDVIEENLTRQLKNYSRCFRNISEIISKLNTKIQYVRNITYDKNIKDLMKSSTCIRDVKKSIEQNCIGTFIITTNGTNSSKFENSIYKVKQRQFVRKTTCSKSELITNCTIGIIEKQCNISNARDIFNSMNMHRDECSKIKKSAVQGPIIESPNSKSTGIIVGTLLGIFAFVFGFYATRKLRTRLRVNAVPNTVEYHQEKL